MNLSEMQQDDVQEEPLQEEEELEVETDVDENAEGEPEEVAEDTDPQDGEGEEGEEEEVGEDIKIPIFLPNENGEEVETEVSYSDISRAITEHEQMRQYIITQDKALKDVAPIIDKVNNSKILQDILGYLNDPRYKSWSEAEIRAGLATLWAQEYKPPTFETKEDEINYRVDKLLKERLTPLEEQMKVSQQQQFRQQVSDTNSTLLTSAMAEIGVSSPTQAQIQAMIKATTDLFPGTDLSVLMLNKSQARAIVREAGIQGEKKKDSEEIKRQKIKSALSLVKRPKIMPGKSVKMQTKEVVSPQKIDGVSTAESLRRKNDLFDSVKK